MGDLVSFTGARTGTYVEFTVVNAEKIYKAPERVTPEVAATLQIMGITVHYLMHDVFALGPGHDCLIHAGAGGVGHIAVQTAKAKGAAEAAPAEEAKAEGTGDTCDAYAKCCMAYADALGKVQGVPESAVTATKDGCKQIEQLKTMGAAAAQACQQGLDAMKSAGEAYKAMPGFVWPEACK